jgi:hypothetical protein
MSWYPGKILERMKERTRAQYWDLPPSEATPEKAEKYFELVFLNVSNDLDQVNEALSSALHELGEIRRQTHNLRYLDSVAGGKYSNIVNQIFNKESDLSRRVYDIINDLEQFRRTIHQLYFERQGVP